MKNIWNKLKQNRFIVARISALVFVFFVFIAKPAHALVKEWILGALGWVGSFMVSIIAYILSVSQFFFQAALMYNLRFGDKLEVIKIGWGISRDVANIFFIVVLLVIAIATILRISSYAAKQLLPGLIIMAVLINFSLTIGLVVVDVSNTLGLQFYNAITDDNTKTVSELIMVGTGIQNVFNFKPPDAGALDKFENGILQNTGPSVDAFAQGEVVKGITEGDDVAFAITAWGNAIFMAVLVFVFFVAAVILLVRVAMISVLLMLAPLAFLFYILPDTQTHWKKWWSTLIQECFFLPAFLFLLYLAIVFILKIGLANKGANPGNFISNPGLIFGYIMAIILLIQALILGRSMGAMGASTAISWAKSGRKMATGYAGRFAARNTIGRAAGQLSSMPGVQKFIENQRPWIGRRLQGYLEKGAAAGGRQKSAEATAAFISRLSPEDQAKKWEEMSFAEKQALLRKLNEKQRERLLGNLTGDQRKLADRILGTSLASDQKADLDASEYQRMQGTEEQKREAYAGLSREAKERVLRTMNQNERADFVQKLRDSKNPNLVAAADLSENILSKDFAPNEYVAYKVAQFNNDTAGNQLARFNNPNDTALDARTRSAILFGMKDDEREGFLSKLADRHASEKIMQDYFPSEKLLETEAAKVNAIKDPIEQRKAFLALKDTKAQEAILRKKTDQQRALFLAGLTNQADRKNAEILLQNMLTPTEYAKYEAQAFLLKSQQEQTTMFGGKDPKTGDDFISDLAREEILRQKKDPNAQALFVENLNQASKDSAKQIIDSAFSPDETAAFNAAAWNLLPPEKQATKFEKENEATQEKILRSFAGERRAGFLATLNAGQRIIADKIIKNNFSLDEQAAIYAEEWKLKIDTETKKDKMDFFANGNELAQEKVLAGFKDTDEMERFVSGLERSKDANHNIAGKNARKLLDSTRFTATQRSEFKKARAKQDVTLADNAGKLYGYFMLAENDDPKIRASMFEAMNERQQIEMFEEAAQNPVSMATFSETLRNMKPHLRETFTAKTLSHSTNEAIENYFEQKDMEIQANAEDSQKQDELRGEKKRAFTSLRGDTKASLWKKAWESKDDAKMEEFNRLFAGTTNKEQYHTALGTILGDKIVKSPVEATDMYGAMDEKARQSYIQSSKGARTLVLRLNESAPSGSQIPRAITADFIAAGQNKSPEFIKAMGSRNGKPPENENPPTTNSGGTTGGVTPIVITSTTPSVSESSPAGGPTARTATVTATPAATAKGVSGEGRKNMNQEAVKTARDSSRIETETVAFSPKVRTVIEQSPEKAAKGYFALTNQDRQEIITRAPQNLIEMKDASSGMELIAIENDIQNSTAAKTFRTTPREINTMPLNDQRIAFEAVASSRNPNEIKTLRAAISQMDSAKRQAFVTDVVSQGSSVAKKTYLQQVVAEKAVAQKAGDTTDVERLTQEETSITQVVTSKSAPRISTPPPPPPPPVQSKPTVDGIKSTAAPIGGASAARISTETAAQAVSGARQARGELVEDANITQKASEAIKTQLETTKIEREIEHPSDTKFVESTASVPQDVGMEAKETAPQSKEERFDSELAELNKMNGELDSDVNKINDERINAIITYTDNTIASFESQQRAESDPVKIQTLTNIIGRFRALKAKAETKLQDLNK